MNSDEEDDNEQNSNLADLEQRLENLWRDGQAHKQAQGQISIAGYRIIEILGRGAFGIVYLAITESTGVKVALKVPRPEVLVDSERRKRFASEALLASELSHPGIVAVLKTEISGPTPYIAAAYCNGPNLQEWLQDCHEPPPWRESVRLMAKIADAVDYAHQKGVSHRDLKPANIMLVSSTPIDNNTTSLSDCEPKVTDFGLAKLSDPMLTDTNSSLLVGTPSYMAPEQMDCHDRCQNAVAMDIYSLGVMLFELLTKELPIGGGSYFEVLDNIRTSTPIGLRTIRSDLPRSLAKICATCLQKNPQARYTTAKALAQDLRNCADNKAVTGKKTSLIEKAIYWSTQPKRIKNAGAFTFGCQSLTLVWFYVSTASLCLFNVVTPQQYSQIMLQDAMIILGSSCLMCWAGWMAMKGHSKGIWLALVMTLLILPLAITPLFSDPILFKTVYENNPAYFSFVIHLVPAMGFLVQAFLLSGAAFAIGFRARQLPNFAA